MSNQPLSYNTEWVELKKLLTDQQAQIDDLRQQLLQKEASSRPSAKPGNKPTSRRRMLKQLAVAAAATGSALAITTQASADFDGTASGASTANYGIYTAPSGVTRPALTNGTAGVVGVSDGNIFQNTSPGLTGVFGGSSSGTGVFGYSTNGNGVYGRSKASSGSTSNGNGVLGQSDGGNGLVGVSTSGNGVIGISDTSNALAGNSNSGYGVQAISTGSYGGFFSSTNTAPIRLNPGSIAGPPPNNPSHATGELYVDSKGDLYYCVANPGTWVKLNQAVATGGNPSPYDLTITNNGPGIQVDAPNATTVRIANTGVVGLTVPNNSGSVTLAGNVNLSAGNGINLSTTANTLKVSTTAATIVFLNSPLRILGSPNSAYPVAYSGASLAASTPRYFKMEGTFLNNPAPPYTTFSDTIPSDAKAIMGTLVAFNASSTGFITIYPADAALPAIATLTYAPTPAYTSTAFTAKLGPIPAGQPDAGKLGVAINAFIACEITLDIVAYIL